MKPLGLSSGAGEHPHPLSVLKRDGEHLAVPGGLFISWGREHEEEMSLLGSVK